MYLDYVIQEWVEENKLAIEAGVRSDMVEDFLKGLKGLFEEHYVDIPEEKVDIVEELISKVDELENKLSDETDKNVELAGQVKSFEKDIGVPFYKWNRSISKEQNIIAKRLIQSKKI